MQPFSMAATTYKIVIPGRKPKIKSVTIDDIESFAKVRKIADIDSSLRLDKVAESKINAGIKKILAERSSFKDWGGEKNDIYTNKLRFRGKRITAAFALKGKTTSGKSRSGGQLFDFATSASPTNIH